MDTIVGTILDVKSFLNSEATQIPMLKSGNIDKFTMKKNRKYIIPDYQREIRWEKENFIELLLDLKRSPKFLGNIILDCKEEIQKYEVIDGQQRTTMLIMIMHYLSVHYGTQVDVFEAVQLEVESFSGFSDFLKYNFQTDQTEQYEKIKESDLLNQCPRYNELWEVLCSKKYIETKNDFLTLYNNLKESKVNIIVHTNDSDNKSIEHFLDVNLKGVKLDDEDIFKGYLFSVDSGIEIRNLWRKLKSNVVKLHEDHKIKYPLMDVIQHGLFCEFCKEDKYKKMDFGKDFNIKEVFELDNVKNYKGTHIVKLIHHKEYMKKCFIHLNTIVDIMLEISGSETPSTSFKSRFDKYNIDSKRIAIIHHFLRKILLDKNVVPKTLVVKYLFEVFIYEKLQPKNDKEICSVFLLSTFFSIFETSKSVDKFKEIIMSEDWINKAILQALTYFDNEQIQTTITKTQYKKYQGEEDNQYQYRCKSLAVIYNFFEISINNIIIKSGKKEELLTFVTDSHQFSLEHLIVNNSGRWRFDETSSNLAYPDEIKKKYKDSIFNFVFISSNLNNELKHDHILKKISIIENKKDELNCDFSKMIFEIVQDNFKLPKSSLKNEAEYQLYIQEKLTSDFSQYYSLVFKKLQEKFLVHNN